MDRLRFEIQSRANTQPIVSFPKTTFELLKTAMNAQCKHCGQKTTPGLDDFEVVFCLKCGACYHKFCGEKQHSYCERCNFNVGIELDSLTVACRQCVVRAPYVNRFGQHMHTLYSDQQYLDEARMVQCIFDVVFGNSSE